MLLNSGLIPHYSFNNNNNNNNYIHYKLSKSKLYFHNPKFTLIAIYFIFNLIYNLLNSPIHDQIWTIYFIDYYYFLFKSLYNPTNIHPTNWRVNWLHIYIYIYIQIRLEYQSDYIISISLSLFFACLLKTIFTNIYYFASIK